MGKINQLSKRHWLNWMANHSNTSKHIVVNGLKILASYIQVRFSIMDQLKFATSRQKLWLWNKNKNNEQIESAHLFLYKISSYKTNLSQDLDREFFDFFRAKRSRFVFWIGGLQDQEVVFIMHSFDRGFLSNQYDRNTS